MKHRNYKGDRSSPTGMGSSDGWWRERGKEGNEEEYDVLHTCTNSSKRNVNITHYKQALITFKEYLYCMIVFVQNLVQEKN